MELLFRNMFYAYCIIFCFIVFITLVFWILKSKNANNLKQLRFDLNLFFQSNDSKMDSSLFHRIMKNEKSFQLFLQVLSKIDQDNLFEKLKSLKPYFSKYLPIIRKETVSFQTSFLSFLSLYPILLEGKGNAILAYVAECTISDSFYIVDQSFLTVCCFGNSELLKKTLMLMNQHEIYHSPKLVTNSLLKFQGDAKVLKEFLAKDIKKYQSYYRQACIDFLGIRHINIASTLLPVMLDKKEDQEVRIACIRYFSNVNYKPAVPYLYEFLKDDIGSWEYAAVAAKTLGHYPSKDTNNHLLSALGSYSWYVRNNAASSLVWINDRDVVKQMLRKIGDKYAHEALTYQLQLKEGRK